MWPQFTKWTQACINEDSKLEIYTTNTSRTVFTGVINQVKNIIQIDSYTWSLIGPPLAITQNADLSHFHTGVTTGVYVYFKMQLESMNDKYDQIIYKYEHWCMFVKHFYK